MSSGQTIASHDTTSELDDLFGMILGYPREHYQNIRKNPIPESTMRYISGKELFHGLPPDECFLWSVIEFHPEVIKEIPYHRTNKKMWVAVLQKNPRLIKYMPSEFIDEEICFSIARHDPSCFEFLPIRITTCVFCSIVVGINPSILRYIRSSPSKKCITKEMCITAVSWNGNLLEYVPSKYRTKKVCRIALCSNIEAIAFVPSKILTESLCIEIVSIHPGHLRRIPEKLRTKKVYKACS